MLNKQPTHWAITVPKATPKTPKLKCNTKTMLRIAFNILIDTNWNIANFADPIREAIGGGVAWIPSTGKIGGPGTEIDIPFAHKDAIYARSFYDTLTISINDAPKPDEILLLFAAASRSRLHARLGGLEEKDIVGNDGLR